MKQIDIINAYSVTETLSDDPSLTIKGKWVLYQVRKELTPHYEFQVQENKRLLEQYNGQYDANTNKINFETAELAQDFQREHNDLDNLEIELNVIKPSLSLKDIPNITVHQIETLEDFIEFDLE